MGRAGVRLSVTACRPLLVVSHLHCALRIQRGPFLLRAGVALVKFCTFVTPLIKSFSIFSMSHVLPRHPLGVEAPAHSLSPLHPISAEDVGGDMVH